MSATRRRLATFNERMDLALGLVGLAAIVLVILAAGFAS
jgi:hypothetical protein